MEISALLKAQATSHAAFRDQCSSAQTLIDKKAYAASDAVTFFVQSMPHAPGFPTRSLITLTSDQGALGAFVKTFYDQPESVAILKHLLAVVRTLRLYSTPSQSYQVITQDFTVYTLLHQYRPPRTTFEYRYMRRLPKHFLLNLIPYE